MKDELHRLYIIERKSLRDIGTLYGIGWSRVRKALVNAGIQIRSQPAGRTSPKLGKHLIGTRRYFTPEWCANISRAKRAK